MSSDYNPLDQLKQDDEVQSTKATTQETSTTNTGENKSGVPSSHFDIGIWGPPNAGKTWFLCAALSHLSEIAEIDHDSYASSGFELKAGFDKTGKVIESSMKFLSIMRNFRQAVEIIGTAKTTQPFSLYITYPDFTGDGLTGRFYRLSMTDAAGENTRSDNDDSEAKKYWEQLRSKAGIFLVIDVSVVELSKSEAWAKENWFSVIDRMRLELGDHIKRQKVAICVTKIDKLIDKSKDPKGVENWSQGPLARKFLKDRLGEQAYRKLTMNLTKGNWEVFLTSAQGWNARQIEPYNVVPPFIWLFDKLDTQRFLEKRNWYERLVIGLGRPNRSPRKSINDIFKEIRPEGDI